MALLFPAGWQFSDANGDPAPSGSTISFYDTGTTTPKTVYSDPELTIALENSYALNSAGMLDVMVYAQDGQRYTIDVISGGSSLPGFPRNDVFGWPETAASTATSLAALTALSATNGQVITLSNNGASGTYRFNSTSTATANNGTVIAPDSGTGRWLLEHNGMVGASQFGVDATGATDASTGLNALAAAADGFIAWVPEGTYLMDSGATFDVPDNCVLWMHPRAVFIRDVSTAATFLNVGSNTQIQGGVLRQTVADTVALNSSCALNVLSESNVRISNVRIEGQFYQGLRVDQSSDVRVSDCYVKGVVNRCYYPYQGSDDVHFTDCIADGRDITSNAALTNYGFNVNGGGVGTSSNVSFQGCTAMYCVNQGFEFGDLVEGCRAVNCVAHNITGNYGFYVQQANSGTPENVVLSACIAHDCAQYGFYINTADNVLLGGCIAHDNTLTGILISNCNGVSVSDFISQGNGGSGVQTSGTNTRIKIVDGQAEGNTVNGILVNNTTTNSRIALNDLDNNTGGNAAIGTGADNVVYLNKGYVTENKGTGTIASGATSVTIAHGLDAVPVLQDFSIIGGEDPTNSIGHYWISGIGSDNFTVNVNADPGASGWDFGWRVATG